MKNFKTLCILLLSLSIISCSSSDDDGGETASTAEYKATMTGGPFGDKHTSTLVSYVTNASKGLTIEITDANKNVIIISLNTKGGFDSGVTKIIGEQDEMGNYTDIKLRHYTEGVTYFSNNGSINISSNKPNPSSEGGQLISGSFSLELTSTMGDLVSMTGTFNNILY